MKTYSVKFTVSFDISLDITMDKNEDIDKELLTYTAYDILKPYGMETNYIKNFSIDAYEVEKID